MLGSVGYSVGQVPVFDWVGVPELGEDVVEVGVLKRGNEGSGSQHRVLSNDVEDVQALLTPCFDGKGEAGGAGVRAWCYVAYGKEPIESNVSLSRVL